MSVLVKNMEMPKNCEECPLGEYEDSEWFACSLMNMAYRHIAQCDRLDDCPLIELPEKHGRLVDVDELSKKMYHDAFESDTDLQKWDSGCWIRYKMFENNRDNTPTVIEAEGER